jgi:hypothetical protein
MASIASSIRVRLPQEVTLLAGEVFPRCSKCKQAVRFRLLRTVPVPPGRSGFRVVLYELPVLEDPEAEAA